MTISLLREDQKEIFNENAGHPLQSWEWGEFRKEAGNEVVRLGIFDGKKLTDAVQILIHRIPKISYKIGTIIKGLKPTKELLIHLNKLAKERKLIFIKLEPNIPVLKNSQPVAQNPKIKLTNLLTVNGAVRGKTLFTPTTFWIDLTKSEDDLMKSFNSKTRYNIRLAQKHGVEVVEDNSDNAFEKYIELTRETVERQGFYAHTERYHRLMWEYLHPTPPRLRGASQSLASPKLPSEGGPTARLLTARYKREIITTWILFVWHDFLYYPYGASTDKFKEVMANNLMMWEAIKYGKKLGLKTFDLWGREEGKGFTKFKEGYSPDVIEFLGTWDLITSSLYWPYRAAELARWNLLRLKSKIRPPTF